MLVTYDEIMAWYEQRKRAGLTIEPVRVQPPPSSAPEQSPCATCRWHIPGKWGSEYCHGAHGRGCAEWTMYRADDYTRPEDGNPWSEYARRKKGLF